MFHVGQQVECIVPNMDDCCGVKAPALGDIGTVVSATIDADGYDVIELMEFPAPACEHHTPGWLARYFRPLTPRPSSASFVTGAPRDSRRWDNRKNKKARA